MTTLNLSPYFSALQADSLTFRRGIEREGLRVDPAGNLARTTHPEVFGSKLCHPLITTDFSESQLELITPVETDLKKTFELLGQIHQVVTSGLGDEILWAASMPCVLQGDPTIPLANYGESNIGRLKRTYRNGLGNRYGRSMQTICAVHYNFSFPEAFWRDLAQAEGETDSQDYRNRRYFDLMRNFRRFAWLPLYLFGASPAVCNSFVKGRPHDLVAVDEGSLHLPFATSLRSGNLGYQSDAQAQNLSVSYNDLASYVQALAKGVTQPYPGYSKIGIKDGDKYLQLNDSILQSEAEFYSSIRAKRVAPSGSNFLQVLLDRGVEYVEVRLLDLDPFEPLGISPHTVRFLDAFLLYCLLEDSPKHDAAMLEQVRKNQNTAVIEGRKPNVLLENGDHKITLKDWAKQILDSMSSLARHLDSTLGGNEHEQSLALQQSKVSNSANTPSARILEAMKTESIPYFRFAMNQSLSHREHHASQQITEATQAQFERLAADSMMSQAEIDNQSEASFDEYVANILAAYEPLTHQAD